MAEETARIAQEQAAEVRRLANEADRVLAEQAAATQREAERVARETQDALEKAGRAIKKSKANPKNWF